MKDFSELKNMVLSSIGKAADAGKDLAVKAADISKDIAGKAADKAKAGTRIAKLSMEIAGEKDNMKKAYIEIGKLYYDTHKDDPDGFFIQLCEEISLSLKNIAEKEAEIEELRSRSDDNDSVDVEFEEVVSGDESAAGCCCDSEASEPAEDEKAECCGEASEPIEDEKAECCCGSEAAEPAEGEKAECCCGSEAAEPAEDEKAECCCGSEASKPAEDESAQSQGE